MSIEDDFYATLKFKSGEEIFAKVAASEEEGRTMLLVHNPIVVCEIRAKSGIVGYKVEPWLKTTREDMFVINLADVLTLSESNDMEMIMLHQNFTRDSQRDYDNQSKLNRKMGYLSTVRDAKENLEKIFKNSNTNNTKSSPDEP
jgi:hypothetical protein